MNDSKIKSLIFNAVSLFRLKNNLKVNIYSNPTLLIPFLELPTNFIKWSPRVTHVFKNQKIKKIKDIINILIETKKLRNFGKKSKAEVITGLAENVEGYIKSKKCKDSIGQIADKVGNDIERSFKYINKGILGLVVNDRIGYFSKVITNEEKVNKFLNSRIDRIDWSVRSANVFKKCNIKKIKDFGKFCEEDLMKKRNFGRKCLKEIYDKLGNFIMNIGNDEKLLDLEKLVLHILSILQKREREVICRRYGLWDGKRETLEEICRSLDLTRERIRQIQEKHIKKIQAIYRKSNLVKLSLENLFNRRLKPYLEANHNIANTSELLKIIYDLDGEKIGLDLANEFLSEVLFDEKPIFNGFVISFDKDVVGLFKEDREFYQKLVRATNACLKEKKNPQSIDEIITYFVKNGFIKDVVQEREKVRRFLTISTIAKDPKEKLGLKAWKYFNSRNIHGMAERALIEINKPAHFTQIALLMNELFPEYGSFDAHNVHARIGSRKDIFVWVAPGVYGLKRWGLERPPYVKDYLIKLLKMTNRPTHINDLTEKVLEKCNCSKSSVSLTLDMNDDTFIKYPERFYGLTSWK